MFEGAPGVPDHSLQRVLSQVEVGRAVDLAPGEGDLVTRGVVVDPRCVRQRLTPPATTSDCISSSDGDSPLLIRSIHL